ncbi:hypothetical protein DL770_010884 [Monosporascus sp. CRB-9-2]|nr:hypothetical protein DL770_010884 [Monosporascus sp. CRB-9-2]
MLPPVDLAILKNNPDFERVYRKVTGVLLNPDGSTRNDALAKKREAIREHITAIASTAATTGSDSDSSVESATPRNQNQVRINLTTTTSPIPTTRADRHPPPAPAATGPSPLSPRLLANNPPHDSAAQRPAHAFPDAPRAPLRAPQQPSPSAGPARRAP